MDANSESELGILIDLGLDFKMDANSELELGILIDLGSDLKFEMIF